MTHPIIFNTLRVSLLGLAIVLSACGGNSSNNNDDNSASSETAKSVSANTMVLGQDATGANADVLSTVQAVVGAGQASVSVACAGGGSALFTATGGSGGSLRNGVLDAGESYSMAFTACKAAAGAASVTGTMTLTVITASTNALTLQTSTQGLIVIRPARTLTLNGSSTWAQTVVTNGATVTTTLHWTSPQIALTSLHNLNLSSLTLSDVDLTRTVTATGGVVTGSTSSGTITIAVAWPNNSWSATIATQGTAVYDANGVATQGSWLMTLPHDRIGLTVDLGTATVTVDHGPDGTIDHTYIFGVPALGAEAA